MRKQQEKQMKEEKRRKRLPRAGPSSQAPGGAPRRGSAWSQRPRVNRVVPPRSITGPDHRDVRQPLAGTMASC